MTAERNYFDFNFGSHLSSVPYEADEPADRYSSEQPVTPNWQQSPVRRNNLPTLPENFDPELYYQARLAQERKEIRESRATTFRFFIVFSAAFLMTFATHSTLSYAHSGLTILAIIIVEWFFMLMLAWILSGMPKSFGPRR